MVKTLKIKLRLTKEQLIVLSTLSNQCRYVYNKLINYITTCRQNHVNIDFKQMNNISRDFRNNNNLTVSSKCIQNMTRDLINSIKAF